MRSHDRTTAVEAWKFGGDMEVADSASRIVVELIVQRTTVIQSALLEGRVPEISLTHEIVRCCNLLLGQHTEADAQWLLRDRLRGDGNLSSDDALSTSG
jgi:hypothetical protein